MGVRRGIHNIERVRHILQVLIRYGFGYAVYRLTREHHVLRAGLLRLVPVRRDIVDLPAPVRLRKAMVELGPTFVKLGQVLSMRPDLIPEGIAAEFEKLQDDVSPFPYEVVETVIRSELKRSMEEMFSVFVREPKASASLAQVHSARLHTGELVVVKVQRPGIRRLIETDIDILYHLARLAERYLEESRLFDPVRIVDEFRRVILAEIDFLNEAGNIERFARAFAGDGTVHIPKNYPEYSSRRVLTMEKVDGVKVSDMAALRRSGLDPAAVARNGADAVMKQVFLFGFFHADPHPGNILALTGNRIGFLDFGMTGHLPESTKNRLADILSGLVHRNIPEVRDGFLSLGGGEGAADIPGLDRDLEDLVERNYGKPLRQLNPGQIMANMFSLVSQHRIALPPDLFLLSKVLIIVDAIGRRLDPEFNTVDRVRPFVEELRRRRYSPRRIAADIRVFARSLHHFFQVLPRDMVAILQKVKQGTLKVEFEHRGLENLTIEMDKVSSRIAFSLIISALIVGSSIIIHADRGPQYMGFPVLGLVGYVAAGLMGLWLVIVILSSGRL